MNLKYWLPSGPSLKGAKRAQNKIFFGRDEKRKGVPPKVNDHTELKMKKLFIITEQGVTNPRYLVVFPLSLPLRKQKLALDTHPRM